MKRLLFEVSAPVRAPLSTVRRFLEGDVMRGMIGGTIRGPGMVGSQGGWWYRGEYTAEASGETTMLVHRVFNVAGRGGWSVPLANRMFLGYRGRLQRGVEQLARQVERRLGDDPRGGPVRAVPL